MKIGFLIDPLENLNLKTDTTLGFLDYGRVLGFETYVFTEEDLFFDGEFRVRVSEVRVDLEQNPSIQVLQEAELSVLEFDACFIRKDPPFDQQYAELMQMLVPVEAQGSVAFINSPSGILKANEKLYGLCFPKFIPPTLVSCSSEEILNFQRKLKTTLVLKPIHEFGSRGIFLLKEEDPNRDAILQTLTQRSKRHIIAQEFLQNVVHGDKRVFFLDGEVSGVISRIPQDGEYRCAVGLGAKVSLPDLSPSELDICETLGPVLRGDGLFFAGVDLIDGKLIEINVTSPTLVRQWNRLTGQRMEEAIYAKIQKFR
jgi:glutathione synthase